MNIISEGDPKKLKRLRRFNCKDCGCVFKADKDEYKANMQYNQTYYMCDCPCCGKSVTTSRPVVNNLYSV